MKSETSSNWFVFPVSHRQRNTEHDSGADNQYRFYCNHYEREGREMTWIVEYVDDGVKGVDKIPAKNIFEAKRNLIAKIGSLKISFERVVKA